MRLRYLFLSLSLCTTPLLGHATSAVATKSANAPDIVMYALPDCGYCAKARQWLGERELVYRELDINDPLIATQWRSRGGQGVPLTIIGDQIVQGFDPQRLQTALDAAR
jgi:glutaredoxin